MAFYIPSADALVEVVKEFTGSSNDTEIKICINVAEDMMRNIELPINRKETILVSDRLSKVPIPPDMNKPVMLYQLNDNIPQDAQQSLGPWIVYDRVTDKEIIALKMGQQNYIAPVNIPATMRGQFGEVGGEYILSPRVTKGTKIHCYYYASWPLLFAPDSTTGDTIQMNGVLQSSPELYVYGTLAVYYNKRKMPEDAAVWQQRFEDSWNRIEDQNNIAKTQGGTMRLKSIWSPRGRQRTLNVR